MEIRTVSIAVKNENEEGVQGATVVIGGTTKTTGSAGGCTFNLSDGDYTVSVSAEDYTAKTESITVAEDTTSFTIVLTSA